MFDTIPGMASDPVFTSNQQFFNQLFDTLVDAHITGHMATKQLDVAAQQVFSERLQMADNDIDFLDSLTIF